jgi:hypothetical protein
MDNLLKIPVYELTTGMFMQIQEMKELSISENNYDLFTSKYNAFTIKGTKKPTPDNNISINALYKKIQTLEKINSELQAKMSLISFDNIYSINDPVKPSFGNILVYTKEQKSFWIVPHSMLDYEIVTTFTTSAQIAGWYFSVKGWQALLLHDNKLHISVKVDEGKQIKSNNAFSILETNLWKVLIQKNNNIFPIYSNLHTNHMFLGNFNNIHRLLVYVAESKTVYVEKIQHTLTNILQWNFTHNDCIILNELSRGNWKILSSIKQEELLQPLFIASLMIHPHEEDIINWKLLVNSLSTLLERSSLHLPKLNLFSKPIKMNLLSHYSVLLKDNNEFKKVENENNALFEEQYLIFSKITDEIPVLIDIKNLLQLFSRREQPRKLDMWIEIIKYFLLNSFTFMKYYIGLQIIKQHETENILNTIQECFENMKVKQYTDSNAIIPLPKFSTTSNFDVWKNVVIKNMAINYRKKIDVIFDYIIKGNDKGIMTLFRNHRLIDIIDEIVLNLYDKLDWGQLVNHISNLATILHIPLPPSFFDQFINMIFDKEMNKKILNEFLTQFTENNHVKEVLMSIDLNELCGYGVHCILSKKKIINPLSVNIGLNGMHWSKTGLKINASDFSVTKLLSSKVNVTNNGLVCGYISFICNKKTFNSTSNVYITTNYDFTKIPSEFHYTYCVNKKAIYFDSIVYNRLLENSSKYIKILGLCSYDIASKKYKIDISCFEPDKEIMIEEDFILHTIDGLPFKYNVQMDTVYIINLQDDMYHSNSMYASKTFWKN